MSHYTYNPLLPGPSSIRLLRLLPNCSEDAPIECQLINYSLGPSRRSSHLYEALSYVWGSQENKQYISIDGAPLDVTANLYAALRRLRDLDLERILWIDAICVNQNDLEERASQVRFMSKIFHYASRVIVWLGEESDDSNLAIETIRSAAEKSIQQGQETNDVASFNTGQSTSMDHGNSNTHGEEDASVQAVFSLLNRPWFRRIWILQEVAVARATTVVCGYMELVGHCFCTGLEFLGQRHRAQILQGRLSAVIYLMNGSTYLCPRENSSEQFSLKIRTLPELIDMFYTHEATDCRDKVYALLGMCHAIPENTGLYPDYRRPWRLLFRSLIMFILGEDANVAIDTWNTKLTALIQGKGCVVGVVDRVENTRMGEQCIAIRSPYLVSSGLPELPFSFSRGLTDTCATWPTPRWSIHSSGRPVERGDIWCLLQGARSPMIIRAHQDFFIIILTATKAPLPDLNVPPVLKPPVHLSLLNQEQKCFQRDFILCWSLDDVPSSIVGDTLPLECWDERVVRQGVVSKSPGSHTTSFPAQSYRLSSMARIYEDLEHYSALSSVSEEMRRCRPDFREAHSDLLMHQELLHIILKDWATYNTLKRRIYELLHRQERLLEACKPLEPRFASVYPDVLELHMLLAKDSRFAKSVLDCIPCDPTKSQAEFNLFLHLFADKVSISTVADRVRKENADQYPPHLFLLIHSIKATTRHKGWGRTLLSKLFVEAKSDLSIVCWVLVTAASTRGELQGHAYESNEVEEIDAFFDDHEDEIKGLVALEGEKLCMFAALSRSPVALDFLYERYQIDDLQLWNNLHRLVHDRRRAVVTASTTMECMGLPDLEQNSLSQDLLYAAIQREKALFVKFLSKTGKIDLDTQGTGADSASLKAARSTRRWEFFEQNSVSQDLLYAAIRREKARFVEFLAKTGKADLDAKGTGEDSAPLIAARNTGRWDFFIALVECCATATKNMQLVPRWREELEKSLQEHIRTISRKTT